MVRLLKMRFKWSLFLGLAVSVLLSAACGAQGADSAGQAGGGQEQAAGTPSAGEPAAGAGSGAPEEEPAAPAEPDSLTVGIVNCTPLCGFRFMAEEKGFFAEHNLEVEFYQNQSQNQQLKALLSGEIDIQETNMNAAMSAIAESGGAVRLKVIGAANPGLAFVLYAKKDIQTAQDLPGKNIGISQPGNLPHTLVQQLLESEGLDPDGVNWVPAGDNTQRIQALIAGKIDAAASLFDLIPLIKDQPDIHVPIRFVDVLPNYTQTTLIVTDETLAEKRDAIERFLIAYGKGHQYALDHPQEAAQVAAKALNQPADETMLEAIQLYVDSGVIHPEIALTPEAIEYMVDLAVKSGRLTEPIPVEQIFDPGPARAVAAALGGR